MPNQDTPLNYTGIQVILDDSKIQTVKKLNFWILESSSKDAIEPVNPKPTPQPEPVDP